MLISVPITVHVSHKLNIFYVLHARVVRGEWKTTCQHACIFVSEMRVHENTRVHTCTRTKAHACTSVHASQKDFMHVCYKFYCLLHTYMSTHYRVRTAMEVIFSGDFKYYM